MRLLRKLECKMRGHSYIVRQRFSEHSRRVGCVRCGGDWAMNDDVRVIVPWTPEFAAFYADQGHKIDGEDEVHAYY